MFAFAAVSLIRAHSCSAASVTRSIMLVKIFSIVSLTLPPALPMAPRASATLFVATVAWAAFACIP